MDHVIHPDPYNFMEHVVSGGNYTIYNRLSDVLVCFFEFVVYTYLYFDDFRCMMLSGVRQKSVHIRKRFRTFIESEAAQQ